jgi:hypothetical protein
MVVGISVTHGDDRNSGAEGSDKNMALRKMCGKSDEDGQLGNVSRGCEQRKPTAEAGSRRNHTVTGGKSDDNRDRGPGKRNACPSRMPVMRQE